MPRIRQRNCQTRLPTLGAPTRFTDPSPDNLHTIGIQTDRQKVTAAWRQICSDHPDAYVVHYPQHIRRMKHRDFVRIITQVCSLRPGSRILETGCGSGRDILYFAASGYVCTAVDINVAWLAQLERAKQVMNRSISLETLGADFFSLPCR